MEAARGPSVRRPLVELERDEMAFSIGRWIRKFVPKRKVKSGQNKKTNDRRKQIQLLEQIRSKNDAIASLHRKLELLSKELKDTIKEAKQSEATLKKLFRTVDRFTAPAVHGRAIGEVNELLSKLDDQELRRLGRMSVMGISRLLLDTGQHNTTAQTLIRYLEGNSPLDLLYFLEPLLELEREAALPDGPLLKFCTRFQHERVALIALECLRTSYNAADDADDRNFKRLIIEPLSRLHQDNRNLMDIRFSSNERRALQQSIKSSLIEQRPFSLLRLGDGEAYPYKAPPVERLEPHLFEADDRHFATRHWGAPLPEPARADISMHFHQAVMRCDILGIPSVYRIIRNMTDPLSRYGETRRNQRAYIRILSALGNAIPVGQKLFTEERCHRLRGAMDEPFLIDLAAMARSVVVVSCRPEIQSKFPTSSVILVPSSGSEFLKIYPEIIERVREASGPGTIVLVGAGILGKILADQARQSAAVALDVGSLMDYMVGQKTRTIADLI